MSYRVKKSKNTPLYVKPQLNSESGTCGLSVMIVVRNDPGKAIDCKPWDSIISQSHCKPWDSNILADKVKHNMNCHIWFESLLAKFQENSKYRDSLLPSNLFDRNP